MTHFELHKVYSGSQKRKNGYTLIELAFTLAIILILSSISIYAYQKVLSTARSTVCKTNLKALKAAIEKYFLENDALPATLGHLQLRHLEKGYATAMEDRGWVTEFSLFLIKFDDAENAYAQYLSYENLKKYEVGKNIFSCPGDRNQGASYAINENLEGKSWSEVDQEDIIVADCDNYVFTSMDQLAKRHDHKALGIKLSGKILELPVSDSDTEKVICHKPGTPAQKTMILSESTLEAHLAHGDTLGPCP